MDKRQTLLMRLRAHMTAPNDQGCIEWSGARDRDGYGVMKIGRKIIAAHRVSWWLAHNTWPDNLCHQCDNRKCIRPSHLRECTHAENMAEKKERNRARNQHMVPSQHDLPHPAAVE